jgi:hypothetical protein
MAENEAKAISHSSLETGLYFLAKDSKYESEKPYTVRFDTEGKFPYTNISNVKHQVELTNLRPILSASPRKFSFQRNGFEVLEIPDRMTFEDFNDDETIRTVHLPYLLKMIQTKLKTGKIHVLEYRVGHKFHPPHRH